MEVSLLNLIVSGIGLAFTYTLFGWGFWIGFRGLMADHKAHTDYGHASGAPGTYDPAYELELWERSHAQTHKAA